MPNGQTNTWATTLKKLGQRNPTQIDYVAESPFPCWPQGVLASAPINKLMIIAKRENHTHRTYTEPSICGQTLLI